MGTAVWSEPSRAEVAGLKFLTWDGRPATILTGSLTVGLRPPESQCTDCAGVVTSGGGVRHILAGV